MGVTAGVLWVEVGDDKHPMMHRNSIHSGQRLTGPKCQECSWQKTPAYVEEAFPGGSVVKNPCPVQETQEKLVRSLSQQDPLKEEMAAHPSSLAGNIPWTEEPGRLQSMGLQRVGHD